MKKILFLLISIIGIVNAATSQITVSILPQKYFVEKITKDKFEINVMVQPGASPHTYEPKTSQMKALAASKVYFSTGVSFEHVWLDKFKKNAKKTLFVDLSNGIEKLAMAEHEHHDEEEHEEHKDEHKAHDHDEHKHEAKDNHDGEDGLDPHIWLDPILVKIQAKNIYETIAKIDSVNSEFYKSNYEVFIKELEALDKEIETILNPYKEKAFMVFHPSWGYFAKKYNLEQIAIEVQGKEPKPNELIELIEEAKKHNIKVVFVSPQFSQKSAKTISSSINASVVPIDPLAENWAEALLNTAKEIEKNYK